MKSVFNITVLLAWCTGFCLASSTNDGAESESTSVSHEFDLFIANKNIGTYFVQKQDKGDIVEYNATSKVEVNFICAVKVEYTLKCIFEEGLLTYSEMKAFKNGKPHKSTVITWNGDGYDVEKDGDEYLLNEPIYHSSVELYFEKPEKFEKVFSESEGKFKIITKKEGNIYNLCAGKNRGSDFTYDGPGLNRVDVDYLIMDFSVVSKN